MNVLPRDKQIEAISALCEGVSVRAAERLTGINRSTILSLGLRVGQGCVTLHDNLVRGVHVARCELDEAWSYVGKKQRRVTQDDPADVGDQYIFFALADSTKAIISYRVGKRDMENTRAFIGDLRARIINRPEISSDAFPAYPGAIDEVFGLDVVYGQVEKHYRVEPAIEAARRYSPGHVVAVTKHRVVGNPRKISTSYIERQNLTLRMQQRRFTRLTNAFSKKLENHCAAVALYVAHYNFCRVHETLRVTPAMQLGITDHVWSIRELVDAALDGTVEPPRGRRAGAFTVIDGGKR